ncbi:MAG: heme-binding protein [Pseudomonadota bacterium]|nr:heme-binding protein [Pseudomonadota bacterium]
MPFADAKRLTNAGAKQMMIAAVEKAEEFGIPITVAIVDSGGHMMLLERMDGGRFHTVHSSTTKAISAASNRRPTTIKGAQGQELDTLHALGLSLAAGANRWTAMEGGFPIFFDGECVGGIGVSGGDWQQDQDIAEAAVEAVGANYHD